MTRGRNDCAHNHPRTTTAPPTTPRPTPPKSNIRLPCALQLFQPPKVRVSPIFWVREHESDARQASRCPSRRAAAPNPRLFSPLRPIHHHKDLTTPFSTSGNTVVRSVLLFDLSVAMKTAPNAYPPVFPHTTDVQTTTTMPGLSVWAHRTPTLSLTMPSMPSDDSYACSANCNGAYFFF